MYMPKIFGVLSFRRESRDLKEILDGIKENTAKIILDNKNHRSYLVVYDNHGRCGEIYEIDPENGTGKEVLLIDEAYLNKRDLRLVNIYSVYCGYAFALVEEKSTGKFKVMKLSLDEKFPSFYEVTNEDAIKRIHKYRGLT